MIAGCSGGLEPVFALAYTKNVLNGQHLLDVNPVFEKYIRDTFNTNDAENILQEVARTGSCQHIKAIPANIRRVFVTALEISPEWHVRMQAAFQKHVDASISKTINMPYEATRQDVADVIMLAHELGCKGLTIYRTGSRTEQVMDIGDTSKQEAAPVKLNRIHPIPRPHRVRGYTEQEQTGCGKIYVTVNSNENGPIETFITTGSKGGCPGYTEGISRLISLALRLGADPADVVDQLRSVTCPNFVRSKAKGKSCPDVIGRILGGYNDIPDIALLGASNFIRTDSANGTSSVTRGVAHAGNKCPECKAELINQEGCASCRCGYSRCA